MYKARHRSFTKSNMPRHGKFFSLSLGCETRPVHCQYKTVFTGRCEQRQLLESQVPVVYDLAAAEEFTRAEVYEQRDARHYKLQEIFLSV